MIIPQGLQNAASNNNAFTLLQRDVQNITEMLGRFAPELLTAQYAQRWTLFELGELKPETQLTGAFVKDESVADVGEVRLALDEVREEAVRREEMRQVTLAGSGD